MIKISINKKKTGLLFGVFLLITILAFYLFAFYYDSIIRANSLRLLLACYSILFLLLATLIYILYRWIKPMHLIIDEKGIWDSSQIVPFGLIPWKEITNIRTTRDPLSSDEIIQIFVKNPSKYEAKATNRLSRSLLRNNFAFYETPIVLIPKSYNYDRSMLYALLINKFNSHHHKS